MHDVKLAREPHHAPYMHWQMRGFAVSPVEIMCKQGTLITPCVPVLQVRSGKGCRSVIVSQQRVQRGAMTRPQAQQMRSLQMCLCPVSGISLLIRYAKPSFPS